MYVIETELGRFEAETEKQAKALLRKAEKQAKEQTAIDEANRDIARLKAAANGFRAMEEFFMERKPSSCAWIMEPSDNYFSRLVRTDEDCPLKSYIRLGDGDAPSMSLYRYRCIGIRLRVCGDSMMIWTQDMDDPSKVTALAVGYHADQWCCCYLPDEITIEWTKGESVEANAPASIVA